MIKHLTRLLLKQWGRLPKSQIPRTPQKRVSPEACRFGQFNDQVVRRNFINKHEVIERLEGLFRAATLRASVPTHKREA